MTPDQRPGGRLIAELVGARDEAERHRLLGRIPFAELVDLDLQLTSAIHAGETRWEERWMVRQEIRSRL